MLAAGPEARVTQPKTPHALAAGQVGVLGVLGQNDWYADSDYGEIRQGVKRALADPTVKTVDLIIDSPGGSVLGLPETADCIFQANRVKPVRAHIVGVAASAAYWLASQASTIQLTPSGEVGSVGVLDIAVDLTRALDSSGVKVTAVSSTPEKIERAPFVPLSDDARANMKRGVDMWYADFLSAIRRGRGARVNPSSTFGGGRMLNAREAVAEGMVDFVSSF